MRILLFFLLSLYTSETNERTSYSTGKELELILKKSKHIQESNEKREVEIESEIQGSVKLLQKRMQKMTQALGKNTRKSGKFGASIANMLRHVDKLNTKMKQLPTLFVKSINGHPNHARAIHGQSESQAVGTKWPSTVDLATPTRHSDPDPHHLMPEGKHMKKGLRFDQMNEVIGEYMDPVYEASGEQDATIARGSRSGSGGQEVEANFQSNLKNSVSPLDHTKSGGKQTKKAARYVHMNQVIGEYVDPDYEASVERGSRSSSGGQDLEKVGNFEGNSEMTEESEDPNQLHEGRPWMVPPESGPREKARLDDAGSGSGSGDGDGSGNFQESDLERGQPSSGLADRIQRIKRSIAAHVAERGGTRFGAGEVSEPGDYTSWPASVDANIPTRLSDPDPHHKQAERKEKKALKYDQMNQVIAEYEDPDYEASGQEDTSNDRGLPFFGCVDLKVSTNALQ